MDRFASHETGCEARAGLNPLAARIETVGANWPSRAGGQIDWLENMGCVLDIAKNMKRFELQSLPLIKSYGNYCIDGKPGVG
jgi:hypothetical protein